MTYKEHKQMKWRITEMDNLLEHLTSNYGESFHFNIVDSNESDPKDKSRLKILTENRQTNEVIEFELSWLDINTEGFKKKVAPNYVANAYPESVIEMITTLESRCRDNKINTVLNERNNG